MKALGNLEFSRKTLSSILRFFTDWIGALITIGVCICTVASKHTVYDHQIDHLLIVSIAFAAFHRGTLAGLISAAIAALTLGLGAIADPEWQFSSEGFADGVVIFLSLPMVFSAGSLRRTVLRSIDEKLALERRHSEELGEALDRARQAEASLAELNRNLEEAVASRTKEIQQAITALMDTEEELRAANLESGFLLRALDYHAATIVMDPQFKIRHANQKFLDMRGLSLEDVIGKTPLDLQCSPGQATAFSAISTEILAGRAFHQEVPIKDDDGRACWLDWTVVPEFDASGNLLRSVGMIIDISERKRGEEELVQFSRAVWQSPASVVITDRDGAIQYVNPTFEEVTGYTLKEVLGKNPRVLKSGKTEDEIYEGMWRAIASGGEWKGELCNRKKSGELFWEHASISGIQDDHGEIISFVAVKIDITAQKQAQEEIEASHLEVVKRLALATEFRDDDTGAHVQRIGYFAAALGEACGLSEMECETLSWASALHDIGKLAIPDSILLKRGKLTEEEYAVMQTHAALGAKMLEGGRGPILEQAEVIARTHHEKWDGSGYPAGLKGKDIPLVGRIVAICDVFDALTSERPYKRAWPFGEAMAEIERCAGTHFDPHLAKLFVANRSRIQLILQMLADRKDRNDESDLLAA
ncbi:MAG: PAS domain S-box protein [Armatimonadetes bacterium]|nr:PAS domain S-box protein [Armatimonadota bacterium]